MGPYGPGPPGPDQTGGEVVWGELREAGERYSPAQKSAVDRRTDAFLGKLYNAVRRFEGYRGNRGDVVAPIMDCIREHGPDGPESCRGVGDVLKRCMSDAGLVLFDVRVEGLAVEPDGLLRVFFDAIDLETERVHPIWSEVWVEGIDVAES